jgi:hypothetical protein
VLIPTEVLFAGKLPPQEATQLVHDFEIVGLAADVREVSRRRSLGNIAWLILAAVPLKSFLDQLVKESATDAYRRFSTFVDSVFRRGKETTRPPSVLVLRDTLTGVQVVLEPDLPAEGFKQLLNLDLATVRRGPLHYDRHRRQWRSELDEVYNATPAPPQDS